MHPIPSITLLPSPEILEHKCRVLAFVSEVLPAHYVMGPLFMGCYGTFTPSDPDCDSWESNLFDTWIAHDLIELIMDADSSIAKGEKVSAGTPTVVKWNRFAPSYSPNASNYPL
ncbi:hypothetical protein KQI84_04105 [bacterium]|nr:hypothetical protein [bacterium]